MIFENISLLQTSQFILYSPLLLSSTTARFRCLQVNKYANNLNAFHINTNLFSQFLSSTVQKEEGFNNKPFESIYGIGESKSKMLIGGIITISIVFLTNFVILGFYCCVKLKSNEGSNELSMSSSLFTNLNQDIKINPNSNLTL